MKIRILSIVIMVVFQLPQLIAQTEVKTSEENLEEARKNFKYAINACPLGIAFGIFSVNIERMHADKHSMVLRVDYENVPQTYTDANIDSYGMSFVYNYRYHIKPEMNSYFIGAYSRYRFYNGTGTIDNEDFDFKLPDVTLGLNAGRRWAWNSGFTMTLAFGYGYSWKSRSLDNSTPEKEQAIDDFENAYDFISPFYGEFSIGYAF